MPLPTSVMEAVGNFLVAILLAICAANVQTQFATAQYACPKLTEHDDVHSTLHAG